VTFSVVQHRKLSCQENGHSMQNMQQTFSRGHYMTLNSSIPRPLQGSSQGIFAYRVGTPAPPRGCWHTHETNKKKNFVHVLYMYLSSKRAEMHSNTLLLPFLARLRGPYTITWRPSSSVSRAHFVTAGAIDPKLCTYVPLGKSNSQIKCRSSLILGLATRGPKSKTQKVLLLLN
jgi:hypothetical protein